MLRSEIEGISTQKLTETILFVQIKIKTKI
jgi:hypothetical protein